MRKSNKIKNIIRDVLHNISAIHQFLFLNLFYFTLLTSSYTMII